MLIAPPVVAAERILDLESALMKAAEPERAEVDLPFPIVDLDEPNILAAQRLTDVDPLLVPANATIGPDAPDFIMARILKRGKARRVWSRRGRVVGGWGSIVEGLVRAERIECVAPGIEAVLLRATGVAGGGRVHSRLRVRCMRSCRPFCWGEAGSIKSGRIPRRIHQTERAESRSRAWVAKGTPLSERIRRGKPYSWKARTKTGRLSVTRVLVSARQSSTQRLYPSAMVRG